MEIIGKVKEIFQIQKFESGFKKRELVITTEEPYPQNILIEFIQDKVGLLDLIKLNDKVKVYFNIRGREWKTPNGVTKYFNSIQGWKIDLISNNISNNKKEVSSQSSLSSDDFDDLPF
ncbi:DUF3127 domain-containing protein [Blattabacterium cuenoti]|uniref:DUF3127 domain-containing protein n=1 Tax=Blattabacterium cuenoti TaxID=1653831 RepID=UPI00163BD61B|nr:DUF3127 domain-containing protein [Blattabacterium cuenoti]